MIPAIDEMRMAATQPEPTDNSPVSHVAAPLVIWAIDSQGIVILSEGAGLRTFGLQPGMAVGRRVEDVFENLPEVLARVRLALRGEQSAGSCRVGNSKGEDSTLDMRWVPLRDATGINRGALGVSQGIRAATQLASDPPCFDELYSQLMQPVPIVSYLAECHAPYCRLHVSSQCLAVVGCPAEIWIERQDAWLNSVDARDRSSVLSHLQQAVDECRIVENEFRLQGPHGKPVYVEERVVAVRAADGTPVCLQGILLDVTARKQAESKMAESDQYLRLLVESAEVGIFTVRRDGRFDYVNPRMVQMLESDEAGLLSRHFSEFLMPEDRNRLKERFARRMQGADEPLQYEVQLQTSNGTTFWAEVSLTPLKVGEQFTGSLVFLQDISRRKQVETSLADLRARLEQRVAERTHDMWLANQVLEEQIKLAREVTQQLQASEAKWLSMVEHAPQIVMLVDKQRKVRFINHLADGYGKNDVFGHDMLEFIPTHQHAFMRRVLENVFTHGKRESYEIDSDGPNGSTSWYSVAIGPIINKQGEQPNEAVLIAADITRRKATEAALQARQRELTQIARVNTMGALTAELAHELNQPLEAISAYANACLRWMSADEIDTAKLTTTLQSVCVQSARAGQIIRRIMDFLRKGDNPRELTDLNGLIRDVVELVDLQGRQHQVSIECDLDPELPRIPANRVQIQQVICNLLFNAIDALRAVDIEARQIRVTSRAVENQDVEVRVHDQGCGFDASQSEELFRPFYTTKGWGMGMGLSISRTIIDEHGGRIWATSEPAGGTTFHFVLPAGIV